MSFQGDCFTNLPVSGTDPAGPNSETFLSGLRKLFKRDKFYVVPKIS